MGVHKKQFKICGLCDLARTVPHLARVLRIMWSGLAG